MRTVVRPVSDQRKDGVKTVRLPWVCPDCGGPRGALKVVNLDSGSRPLYRQRKVHFWRNPCGHTDPALRTETEDEEAL